MNDGILYHNPGCSKSRAALDLLRQRGLQPELRDYRRDPPDARELAGLIEALEDAGASLLRQNEPEFAASGLGPDERDPMRLATALARFPGLLQRPIFLFDGRAVIGRPPERVLELLAGA